MTPRHRPNRIETVAKVALSVAERSFPSYAHPKSPHLFRLPQLIACIVMKTWLRQDYRGFIELLEITPRLREALGLKRLPHYSTLAYVFQRAVSEEAVSKMLEQVLRAAGIKASAAAIDSTGLQVHGASAYYLGRKGQPMKKFVRLGLAVLLPSFLVASARAGWPPSNDSMEFLDITKPAAQRVQITDLYADAGYDAEWIHRWCREEHGIRSWIPLRKIKKDGTATGNWRNQMAQGLPAEYGRRWGVETVFSVIKRRWGAVTTARTPSGQRREALLKTVVYAIDR